MNDVVTIANNVSEAEKNVRNQLHEMTKPKLGRPTKLTKPVIDEICLRLMTGESLLSISQSKNMPAYQNIMLQMSKNPIFRDKIARAREYQMDALVDQMIDLAMSASPEEVNKARLVTDLMKWTASKLKPKTYGEKIEQETNINISFQNSLPRPNVLEGHTTYSVPKKVAAKTVKSEKSKSKINRGES